MASDYSRARKAGEDAANDYRAGISAGRIKAKMPPVRAAVKKSAKTSKRKTKRS